MSEKIETGIPGTDIQERFYVLFRVEMSMFLPEFNEDIRYDIGGGSLVSNDLLCEVPEGCVKEMIIMTESGSITLPELNNMKYFTVVVFLTHGAIMQAMNLSTY
jgi:hypothetical protein